MTKKYLYFTFIFFLALILTGCAKKNTKKDIGDGGVYKSIDAGKTFHHSNGISAEKNISKFSILDIAIDNQDSNIVYIGTSKNGIYKSKNGGETWLKSQSDFSRVYRIQLDPINQQIIYVIANNSKGERALFKTTDGGVNWKRLLTQRNNVTPKVSSLILDKKNANILYAGDSVGGLYKSTDGGQKWRALVWNQHPIEKILIDPQDSSLIYFINSNYEIFRSKDAGKSFVNISKNNKTAFGRVYSMNISEQEENTLYILSTQGLFVTHDAGETYEMVNTLLPPKETVANIVTIDPLDKNILYIVAGKVLYKSSNRGRTWEVIPLKIKWSVSKFIIDRNNVNIIFIGVRVPIKPKNWGIPMPF